MKPQCTPAHPTRSGYSCTGFVSLSLTRDTHLSTHTYARLSYLVETHIVCNGVRISGPLHTCLSTSRRYAPYNTTRNGRHIIATPLHALTTPHNAHVGVQTFNVTNCLSGFKSWSRICTHGHTHNHTHTHIYVHQHQHEHTHTHKQTSTLTMYTTHLHVRAILVRVHTRPSEHTHTHTHTHVWLSAV